MKRYEISRDRYNQMAGTLRKHPGIIRTILIMNRILTALGFLAYPLLLGFMVLARHNAYTGPGESLLPAALPDRMAWAESLTRQDCRDLLLIYLILPALAFVLLSIYRRSVNRPRPYESMDIIPIIKKDKKGRSFPSRHIFSLSLIAMIWCPFSGIVCLALVLSSLLLAAIRVIGGVHYVRDVTVGFLTGCGCGLVINLVAWIRLIV